ncbi:MAG: Ig-like domain-containing protein [Clostridia bacterium]|nr:Ig-like domain-containing protein [Clostridia bacterium]
MKKHTKLFCIFLILATTLCSLLSGCDFSPLDSDDPPATPPTVVYTVTYASENYIMNQGQSGTPTVTVKANGQNASTSVLTFSSSNPAVATVNSSGKITAVAGGTCIITASVGSGENYASDNITVTVSAPTQTVYAVNFADSIAYVKVGNQITPNLNFTIDGNPAPISQLSFSSSNPAIATVNSSGVVTGVSAGSCVITTSIGSGTNRVFDTITVTVNTLIPTNPSQPYTLINGTNGVDFILDFPSGKDITVLQITDTQTINYHYSRTQARQNQIRNAFFSGGLSTSHEVRAWRYIREGVQRANPDIIVATGDNVYGEGDDDGAMWNEFISVMDSFAKPWLTVFGNHDNESRKGVQWQVNQLLNSQYCIFKQGNMTGNSNYNVLISSGGVAKYLFYMFDNHGCRVIPLSENGAGGEGIEPDNVDIAKIKQTLGYADDQVNWFGNSARSAFEFYGQLPILIFQHVPIAEYRNAMRDQYGIDWGQSLPSNPFYTNLTGDFGFARELTAGNMYREDVWMLFKNTGCKGIFVGHEHRIATSVMYGGIRLTFGLKTGTYAYHSEDMLGTTKINLDVSEKTFSVAHQFTDYAYSTNKS